MNTPNPLMPQGSLQQSKGKSNVRFAFFTILAIHVVLLCGLLMQGCKRDNPQPVEDPSTNALNTFEPMPGNDLGTTSAAPVDPNAGLPVDPTAGLPVDPTIAQPTPAPTGAVTALPPVPAPGGVVEPTITPDIAPAGEAKVHVVQKGEMLSTIARKYGVSVRSIEGANPNVDPLKLQIGQKLNIPAPAATSTAAPAAAASTAGGEITYTVKSGDALEKIARQHNTTVKAIKALNNMRTDRINVGQKLKIPSANGTTNQ